MSHKVAVVIPCYKVRNHILDVISRIGPEVLRIYVIDDCCPDGSGELVKEQCTDPRVQVFQNTVNLGVGGAVMHGYQAAIADGMDIAVKVDGDGQMDPALIPDFIAPITAGTADYTKGNRFFDLEGLRAMPRVRLFGNAVLSLLTKLSSGYRDLFDPTNGFTAIQCRVAQRLPLKKISNRYFFETDILFRLNTLRAVVVDVPMAAKYEDEVSNLHIGKAVGEFLLKHLRNFGKRIFYNYFLRDMSLASIELVTGLLMIAFASTFGISHWLASLASGVPTTAGTVMLFGMSMIVGIQLVLAFLAYDISALPRRPLHKMISSKSPPL